MVYKLVDSVSDHPEVGVVPALLMLTDTTTSEKLIAQVTATIMVAATITAGMVMQIDTDPVFVLAILKLLLQSPLR